MRTRCWQPLSKGCEDSACRNLEYYVYIIEKRPLLQTTIAYARRCFFRSQSVPLAHHRSPYLLLGSTNAYINYDMLLISSCIASLLQCS